MPLPPPRTKQQYRLWKAEEEQRAKQRYWVVYRMVEDERLMEAEMLLETAMARVAERFGVTQAQVSYQYKQVMEE